MGKFFFIDKAGIISLILYAYQSAATQHCHKRTAKKEGELPATASNSPIFFIFRRSNWTHVDWTPIYFLSYPFPIALANLYNMVHSCCLETGSVSFRFPCASPDRMPLFTAHSTPSLWAGLGVLLIC